MKNISLVKYEFQKHRTRFNVLLIIVIFVFSVGIVLYQFGDQFSSDAKAIRDEKLNLLDIYKNDQGEYSRLYDDYQSRLSDYNAQYYKYAFDGQKSLPEFENVLLNIPNYGDIQLFNDVESIINASKNYMTAVTGLLSETSVRLLAIENTDSFTYDYYIKLLNKYETISDITWEITPIFGWNEYFSVGGISIFLLMLSMGLYSSIFTFERHKKISNIIRLTKHGTVAFARAKLIYITLTSAVLSVIFTLTPLLILSASCGLSGGNLPIQALDDFVLCPYRITIIQYLIIYTLIRTLFIIGFSLIIASANRIAESELYSMGLGLLICAISFVSGNIKAESEYYFLQRFNLIGLADVNCLFEKYNAINILNKCVNYTLLILSVMICICVLCVAVLLYKSGGNIADEKKSGDKRLSRPFYSIEANECYKLFICSKGAYIILGIVILKLIISGLYYSSGNGTYEKLYRSYVTEVEGPVTTKKLEIIKSESEYIAHNIDIYDEMKNALKSGAISGEEYSEYLGKYNYSVYCKNAHARLSARRDYLLNISKNHHNIEFIYDEGLDRLFKTSIDLSAALFSILIGSIVFSQEYSSGFSKILRLTKNGRKKIFLHKYVSIIIAAAAIYAVLTAVDLSFSTNNFGVPDLSVNIISIPRFEQIQGDMSVLEYLILYKSIGFIGFIVFTALVTSLSEVFENQMKTVIISGTIVFIPYIANYLNIGFLDIININRFISPEKIFDGIFIYIFYTAVTMLIVFVSYRKWAGEKIQVKIL